VGKGHGTADRIQGYNIIASRHHIRPLLCTKTLDIPRMTELKWV
jgi:hypothetical protein